MALPGPVRWVSPLALALAVALLGLAAAPGRAAPPESAALRLVVELYQAYAWEALIQTPMAAGRGFEQQPRAVLERYLTPQLAARLAADQACRLKSRAACRIDFKVLWDSQDPAAQALHIQPGPAPGLVSVRYTLPGSGQVVQLDYEVVTTPRGPRVRDIRYPQAASLARLLQPGP